MELRTETLRAAMEDEIQKTKEGDSTGIIMVRLSSELHKEAKRAAHSMQMSLNLLCRRAILRAVMFPDGPLRKEEKSNPVEIIPEPDESGMIGGTIPFTK